MLPIPLYLIFLYTLFAGFAFAFDEEIAETQCVCGNGIQEILPKTVNSCPYKLYGATAAGPTGASKLVYLNPFDGTATDIATIRTNDDPMLNQIRSVNGLDFSPSGVLYATGRNTAGTQAILATVDCLTGLATIIGNAGSEPAITDINFDRFGQLWAHATHKPTVLRQDGILGKINIATGAFTTVGSTLINDVGNGIGFDYPMNILYHAGHINLSTLNQMTGVASTIHSLLFGSPTHNAPRINGMDYDKFSNIMYVSINDKASGMGAANEDYLGTINLSNGEVSFVKMPPNKLEIGLSAVTVNRPYETCDQGGTPDNNPPLPPGTACSMLCGLVETECQDMVDNDFDGLVNCQDDDCPACDDGNACTTDSCTNGACVNTPVLNGTLCDDANVCTSGDQCLEGVCAGIPVMLGTLCDDGNPCTIDACVGTICVGTPNGENFCTDQNPCTVDVCQQDGSCDSSTFVADDPPVSCDDELACSTDDVCVGGDCIGTPGVENCQNGIDDDCDTLVDGDDPDCGGGVTIEDDCQDGLDNDGDGDFDCFDEDCDGLQCESDDNTCTDDTCNYDGLSPQDSTCDHTPNVVNLCSDSNDCTDDACNILGLCVGTPNPANTCDDGNSCTTDDNCSGVMCVGTVDCDDNNVCTTDSCGSGGCSHAPVDNNTNTPCPADNNACTDSKCVDGACSHDIDPSNPCSDGLACSTVDVCNNLGECVGTQPGVESCAAGTCDDGIDNDCDFKIDTFDSDCSCLWLRIFVTRKIYDPDFGVGGNAENALDADALCNTAALGQDESPAGPARTGTYVAFVSTSTSDAADRLINPNGRPYYMFSDARVADNLAHLLGTDENIENNLIQSVNVMENGFDISTDNDNQKFVWTGSLPNGQYNNDPDCGNDTFCDTCNNWSTTAANVAGTRGATDEVDRSWVNQPDATCNQAYRLYCVEIDTNP